MKPPRKEFHLTWEFNATKKRVFSAFADEASLNAWWGPVGMKNSVVRLDFREGGIFHFKMEAPGVLWYGRFQYLKIQPYDKLEFTNAFCDADANVITPPFGIPFPREIHYSIRFHENGRKTTIVMKGTPWHASEEEAENYLSMIPDIDRGFGSTFKNLDSWLSR